MENKAAYLLSIKAPLSIQTAPLTQPGVDEILIRNHAIAINPVDYKQQESGVLVAGFPYVGDLFLAPSNSDLPPRTDRSWATTSLASLLISEKESPLSGRAIA